MERLYKTARTDIAAAIRGLIETENVVVNRAAVEAGLAIFDAGGDFADGVIAFDGRFHGGRTFLSFDRKAVKLLQAHGDAAMLLGSDLHSEGAVLAVVHEHRPPTVSTVEGNRSSLGSA